MNMERAGTPRGPMPWRISAADHWKGNFRPAPSSNNAREDIKQYVQRCRGLCTAIFGNYGINPDHPQLLGRSWPSANISIDLKRRDGAAFSRAAEEPCSRARTTSALGRARLQLTDQPTSTGQGPANPKPAVRSSRRTTDISYEMVIYAPAVAVLGQPVLHGPVRPYVSYGNTTRELRET